jgi:hypothetical protein
VTFECSLKSLFSDMDIAEYFAIMTVLEGRIRDK